MLLVPSIVEVTIREGTDWVGIVGLVIAFMAMGATAALAFLAYRAWQSAQGQITELSRARKATLLPFLLPVDVWFQTDRAQIKFDNLGAGPALAVNCDIWMVEDGFVGEPLGAPIFSARRVAGIAAGTAKSMPTRRTGSWPPVGAGIRDLTRAIVDVWYDDAFGTTHPDEELHIRRSQLPNCTWVPLDRWPLDTPYYNARR